LGSTAPDPCAVDRHDRLRLSGRLGWAADRQLALATDMAEELAATGRPADAAALYADYVNDAEAAVAHHLQAHAWREALRTAYRCFAAGWAGSRQLPCCCTSALLALLSAAESLDVMAAASSSWRPCQHANCTTAGALNEVGGALSS
jgi:hypothetical protein